MGDQRRFDLFAKLISGRVRPEQRILDVAGGKGYLRAALHQAGYKNITTIDKRREMSKGRPGLKYGYLDWQNTNLPCDIVVAMHPDEATDHVILYAAKLHVPFMICPCCIRPSAVAFWQQYKYKNWVDHLERLAISRGMRVQHTTLQMRGKNDVLIGEP